MPVVHQGRIAPCVGPSWEATVRAGALLQRSRGMACARVNVVQEWLLLRKRHARCWDW